MRREVLLALGLAGISGIFAASGIHRWISSEQARILGQKPETAPQVEMTSVVVAKDDLGFGVAINRDKLEETQWPKKNVPKGSFKTIQEFLAQQETRVVLEPIQASEPILKGKVTGPGQRSGLATMLEHGKKAVSIRINDVVGVGGLVLPGDRVDIFVTDEGKADKNKEGSDAQAYTDLLLQNVRVLAVDQILDPKRTEPILGRTVTVEASLAEAQKITLASTIGSLTLVLRESSVAEVPEIANRLTVADLTGNSGDNLPAATLEPTNAVAPGPAPVAPVVSEERKDLAKVNVVRATAPTEYSVPKDSRAD